MGDRAAEPPGARGPASPAVAAATAVEPVAAAPASAAGTSLGAAAAYAGQVQSPDATPGRRTVRTRLGDATWRAHHVVARTLWGPALVLGGATAALALLAEVDPNEPGHYPTCPSLLLTGLHCPGCGSLRMLHALTQRDLAGAVAMNPLGLLLLPALVGYYLEWVWLMVTGRPRRGVLPGWLVWSFLIVVCAYWVLRNVPATSWLAPG